MRAFSPTLGTLALLVFAAACARPGGPGAASPGLSSFRVGGVAAAADPTVKGARLLPENVDDIQSYGNEPGGGTRAITSGLRVVTTHEGGIFVAEDRLPQPPQITIALPERVGGGFLFVLGTTVWRADHWLDRARPVFSSFHPIVGIVPGLDRVYVRSPQAYVAIDGKTGSVLDLGPWPASPFVASYAAADGWRAAAVTDLRGAVATFDAGATWRSLELPMDARQVIASGDSLAIGGIENGKTEAWFEVRGDGTIARLSAPPREAKGKLLPTVTPGRPYYPGGFPGGFPGGPPPPPVATSRPETTTPDAPQESPPDSGARIFGKRPLAAAIEDGWPLTDGTAVVARDGALARVRLADGAITELATSAFPLKPARCHPVSLNRPNAIGAFGFVCGEPRGATVLYTYDVARGRLNELRRFDRPRVVTPSGNGALAVRGPCAEDGDASSSPREPVRIETKEDAGAGKVDLRTKAEREKEDADQAKAAKELADAKAKAPEVHPYCVFGYDNVWREIHVRGDASSERIVVLADGKIAVVSPPQGQTTPARVTLLDKGKAVTLPIVFPKVTADVGRVLRLGVWLDGFEERRPGVLGGWIEAGGAMLGVEIALDGKATPGQLIRDAGSPFVSGRYGFGWTQSRRGYETTDGGMTWTSLELPEALLSPAKVERRACGPIGCLAAGFLRVGWGEAKKEPIPQAPAAYRPSASSSPPQLALTCEPASPPMPAPPAPRVVRETSPVPVPRVLPGGRTVFGPGQGFNGVSELPAFFAQGGPPLHDAERGVPFEVQEFLERYPRIGPLSRIYAWGPKGGGDWDTQGKWQVKWLSPFAGWQETHASLPVLPPQPLLDFTRGGSPYSGLGFYGGGSGFFTMAFGDEPSHALLLARRPTRADITPFDLEADRAPVEIRRADGEPFVEIEAATRAAGRWYLITPPPPGAPTAISIVWQVDGAVARELLRVTRSGLETGRPVGSRLARRSDGRAIGLVVEGQQTAERDTATRWVLPIDLETAQPGEPELLGYTDLAGRTLDPCTDDVSGWTFDTSLPNTSARLKLPAGVGALHSVYARVRMTTTRACVERLAGTYDGQSADRLAQLVRAGAPAKPVTPNKPGELVVSVFSAGSRSALRCSLSR